MPRPRFEKLADEKREEIMVAAAKEFAREGYEGASLNQILSEANLSKGAAYYYFDDKADLFATTVEHYSGFITSGIDVAIDSLTAENFWDVFEDIYGRPFLLTYNETWRFGVVKAASKLPPDSPILERLAPLFESVYGLLAAIILRGQELGVIRTDLPQDLLVSYVGSIDDASDHWLLQNMDDLTEDDVRALLHTIVSAIRGLLTPTEN